MRADHNHTIGITSESFSDYIASGARAKEVVNFQTQGKTRRTIQDTVPERVANRKRSSNCWNSLLCAKCPQVECCSFGVALIEDNYTNSSGGLSIYCLLCEAAGAALHQSNVSWRKAGEVCCFTPAGGRISDRAWHKQIHGCERGGEVPTAGELHRIIIHSIHIGGWGWRYLYKCWGRLVTIEVECKFLEAHIVASRAHLVIDILSGSIIGYAAGHAASTVRNCNALQCGLMLTNACQLDLFAEPLRF